MFFFFQIYILRNLKPTLIKNLMSNLYKISDYLIKSNYKRDSTR